MAATLPAGTAVGNSDAVRQGTVSQVFYLVGDFMKGMDSQPVMDASTRNNGLLGPTPTLGSVDIGIGVNGDVFIRGNPGSQGNGQQAAAPASAGLAIKPWHLIAAAVVAYLVFK